VPTTGPSRRRFLQTALGSVALLGVPGLLAACGGDDDGGSPAAGADGTSSTTAARTLERVSYLAPFPIGVSWIAEIASRSGGFMADEGVDVDVQFARSAPQALQQLAAGGITMVGNGPLAVVRAVSQEGAPFITFAMTVQRTLYRLVSTDEAPVRRMEDLAGKTIGFPTLGGNAEDVFNLIARGAGVNPDEVTRVAVGNDAAAMTFVEQGRVDVIFATTEAVANMRLQGLDPHVELIPGANPLLGTSLVTTKETLAAEREGIVRYLRGLRASMLALRDPAAIEELLPQLSADWGSELPQLNDAAKVTPVIEAVAENWFLEGEDDLLRHIPENWEEGVANFERLGIAKAGSDPTSFYTNDLHEEAFG
jgi:ABC-type nitrate/sulfonate/bicarbonate transport system substrate-binding protein